MAKITPFKGILYNPEKVGDMAKVMAPPYDVISQSYQDELYSRHPHNAVRLILGRTSPDDAPGSDRYTRAASDLRQWLANGVLMQDKKPAIYYYTQSYALNDKGRQTRAGFLALSRIEEFGKGKIHAHEQTLSGPKADRLKLMLACNANLSAVFSLYSEPSLGINKTLDGYISGQKPLIDVTDDNHVENRLWRVVDPQVIRLVTESMAGKTLFIADGHHRYETALNYRNIMREKNPDSTGTEPYNYVLMYFSNMDGEGMTIWPTHRVVHGLKGFEETAFMKGLSACFDIEEFNFASTDQGAARDAFLKRLSAAGQKAISIGMAISGSKSYFVLTLKGADVMDKAFGSAIPEVFRQLDVTVLHRLVLEKLLGISREAEARQENLIYVKNSSEALNAVKTGPVQLVFLLNPTRIEQVKAAAEAGFVMPQKSTYFYPKLLSGLVFTLLDSENAALRAVRA
ncbi:MAG: DUF1015 domain-containing protein [Deltaproteobacteria bacterium]|nr:DUF1015 domain-containing protein [Deltaproteobacteria bacterium]